MAQHMPAARELMLPETLRAASTGRQICADAATEALAVLGVLTMNSDAPYIAGGRWRTTPNTFAVSDPATDDVLAHVADCGPHETESAIQDAQPVRVLRKRARNAKAAHRAASFDAHPRIRTRYACASTEKKIRREA